MRGYQVSGGGQREREESERPTPGTKREKPVARLHLPDPSSGIGTPVRFQTGSNVEEAGLTIARHRAAFHSFAQFEFDRETRRFQHHRSFGSIRFGSVRFGSARFEDLFGGPSLLFFSLGRSKGGKKIQVGGGEERAARSSLHRSIRSLKPGVSRERERLAEAWGSSHRDLSRIPSDISSFCPSPGEGQGETGGGAGFSDFSFLSENSILLSILLFEKRTILYVMKRNSWLRR